MLTIHTILDKLTIWVNVIQNCVCVSLMASCENYYLEMLISLLKALHYVGTYVDACVDCFFIWKIDLKNDIWILRFNIIYAMNKCLIHVENDDFLHYRKI